MKINKAVKKYALAFYMKKPEDPAAARGDLELTPQLIRLARFYRAEISVRALDAYLRSCERYDEKQREAMARRRREAEKKQALSAKDDGLEGLLDGDDDYNLLGIGSLFGPGESDPAEPQKGALEPWQIIVCRAKAPTSDRDRAQKMETIKGITRVKDMAGVLTRHRIDETYAKLFDESPWLREPLTWLWRSHLQRLDEPWPSFWLPPFLLVGPPGCGKSHIIQRLAALSGVPHVRIDMSSVQESFGLVGIDGAWSSARSGEPVMQIANGKAANPLIFLDEIEKAGSSRNAADPLTALLPLLQRDTARTFFCPAIKAQVDLSHVTYAMAANDLRRLPAPLLDRVTVFQCASPSGQDLRRLVKRRLEEFDVGEKTISTVVDLISSGKMSLRGLDRLENSLRQFDAAPRFH